MIFMHEILVLVIHMVFLKQGSTASNFEGFCFICCDRDTAVREV